MTNHSKDASCRVTNAARTCLLSVCTLLVLFLAGCAPTNQYGAGTNTGISTFTCDPKGFGPLSGCGGSAPTVELARPDSQSGQPVNSKCDPKGFGPLSGCGSGSGNTPNISTTDESFDPDQYGEIALHEASHKAIADYFGWPIRVTVIRKDGSGNMYLRGFGLPCRCPTKIVALGIAGEIGSSIPASGPDRRIIDRGLRMVPDDQRYQTEIDGTALAESITRDRHSAIKRDAALLLANGSIE